MDETKREVPPDRKAIHSIGSLLAVIGVLLFASTFVTFITNFGSVGQACRQTCGWNS